MAYRSLLHILFIIFVELMMVHGAWAEDLRASIGIIPPHSVNGPGGIPEGGFVDLVKAMDRVYTDGKISISLFPIARGSYNVKSDTSDFFIPAIPNPFVAIEDQPHAFAEEPITQVVFILYTRADKSALPMDRLCDFQIDVLRGTDIFDFEVNGIDDFRQGILKVLVRRSDGFISEQDGADAYIREHKIKNIRRTMYKLLNSSVIIPKGPRGKEIDRIVSKALRTLKEQGELSKITERIHKPYMNWQPYKMDW